MTDPIEKILSKKLLRDLHDAGYEIVKKREPYVEPESNPIEEETDQIYSEDLSSSYRKRGQPDEKTITIRGRKVTIGHSAPGLPILGCCLQNVFRFYVEGKLPTSGQSLPCSSNCESFAGVMVFEKGAWNKKQK